MANGHVCESCAGRGFNLNGSCLACDGLGRVFDDELLRQKLEAEYREEMAELRAYRREKALERD